MATVQSEPTILCRRCGGAGHIPLSPPLRSVYDVLERAGSTGLTSSAIAKALEDAGDNAALMAIQNRLLRMEEHGIVSRTRAEGGPEIWRIVEASR